MEKTKLELCMEAFPQTDIWMDSFSVRDHEYAVAHRCKGITTSPTWVGHMLCDEYEAQTPLLRRMIAENPSADEREIAWKWTLEMGRQRSRCMLPEWEKGDPRRGRFAIQVSVYDYRSAERMLRMAEEVHALGPNMQAKIPCTAAGIAAMEEATYRGVSVMATLCFSADQALAAAEAMERGLARREAEGLETRSINPVCAVLLGMQEDWLRRYADAANRVLDPEAFTFAGEAVAKQVYTLYRQRGFRTRVLVAYYRHHRHWSAFMGGDLIMTIPWKWQRRFEACDVPIADNIGVPVPGRFMDQLMRLEPFAQAMTPGSLCVADFDAFPPVILTLRYFTDVYEKGVLLLRDLMLPEPV